MIYKGLSHLTPGMILERNIFDGNGKVLLQNGVKLTNGYIDKLERYNIRGVYIRNSVLGNNYIDTELLDKEDIEGLLGGSNYISLEREVRTMYCKLGVDSKANDRELDDILKVVKDLTYKFTPYKGKVPNLLNIDLKLTLSLMENVDNYLYRHSVNVAVLSLLIGLELNLSEEDLQKLTIGALLHDIGTLFVDQDLINKPGILTEEEYEQVKEHSSKGYRYVRDIYAVPTKSYIGILQHHERYDGLGYPNKLKGDDIFIFGRIIAIADVYDALISNRPYRNAMSPKEAIEYIMGGADTLFDYELVNIFVNKIAPYPLGTIVNLSNGFDGVVVGNNNGLGCRPKVQLIDTEDNKDIVLDLSTKENINIVIM